jgi:hypothetical protein
MSPPMERKEIVSRLEKLRPKLVEVFSFNDRKQPPAKTSNQRIIDLYSSMRHHREKIMRELEPDGRNAFTMRKINDLIEAAKTGKADPETAVRWISWEVDELHRQAKKALERIDGLVNETVKAEDIALRETDKNEIDRIKAHMVAPASHVASTIGREEVIDELENLMVEIAQRSKPAKPAAKPQERPEPSEPPKVKLVWTEKRIETKKLDDYNK